MKQPVLLSTNIVLRPFSLEDAEGVNHLAGDPRVSGSTLNIPYPYTIQMAKDWISSHSEIYTSGTGLIYAVEDQKTGGVVGTVSLVSIEGDKAEIGYWMGHAFWGKGYCTEAVGVLINFIKSNLDLKHLYAEHLASNPASGKVMIKNGMHFVESITRRDRNGLEVQVETYELNIT